MRAIRVACVAVFALLSCSNGETDAPGESGGTGGGAAGTGGATSSGGAGGSPTETCDPLGLEASIAIPAGQTLTLCAGTTLVAAADVTLTVEGTLVVNGTEAAPVKFGGAAASPGSWTGIVIAGGSSLQATWLEIRDADWPLDALAGSLFSIDHVVIEGSRQLARLASGGTLAHGVLHGLGAAQKGEPVLVKSASPSLTDTLIDGGNAGVDLVTVNGSSSAATFDHIEVTQAHCAFHFNQGSALAITSSYIHDVVFGLMLVGSTTDLDHNVFENNTTNVGACVGGVAQRNDNWFDGAPFDGSCSSQSNDAPAAAKPTDVGPRP